MADNVRGREGLDDPLEKDHWSDLRNSTCVSEIAGRRPPMHRIFAGRMHEASRAIAELLPVSLVLCGGVLGLGKAPIFIAHLLMTRYIADMASDPG